MFKSKRYNDTFSSQDFKNAVAYAEEERAISQEIKSLKSGIDFILAEVAEKIGISQNFIPICTLYKHYGEYDHLKYIIPICKK